MRFALRARLPSAALDDLKSIKPSSTTRVRIHVDVGDTKEPYQPQISSNTLEEPLRCRYSVCRESSARQYDARLCDPPHGKQLRISQHPTEPLLGSGWTRSIWRCHSPIK